ncbi:MAG: DUF3047 domain-containing protein [Magnetovibrio sp.]|nr:DUF3047 domain-containing protein [Magnetovibrio sp.]
MPPAQPTPEGLLTVMGSTSALNLNAPPSDWVIVGGDNNTVPVLSNVTMGGIHALELRSGQNPVIAVRKVDAMMLATPYLSWSWHLSNHGAGIHPVRLVIGFEGGLREGDETGSRGADLPEHDRALTLVWGDSALRRGALSLPPIERPFEAPVYTVRGGRENTRTWWSEAVDLSSLYAQAWPQDNHRRVRIKFIGLAAAHSPSVVRGRIAQIVLTH